MKPTFLKTSLIGALSLAMSNIAFSQNLDPIIVSANQTQQTLQQITADTYIISAQTIENKHYSTVLDALREVPGISFTRNGGLGATTNIYLRGSNNSRVLVLIDGVRVNNPASTNGADFTSLSLANIERIEIIKGAQSGVWGSDAAAGVINLITKKTTGHQIYLETGSYNTQKAGFQSQVALGEHKLNLSGERLLSEGFSSQAPYGTNMNDYEKDGFAQTNLNASVNINLGNQQHLIIGHNYTNSLNDYDAYNAPDANNQARNIQNLSSLIWQNPTTQFRLENSSFETEQLASTSPDIVKGQTQAIHLKHQIQDLTLGASYNENSANSDKYDTFKQLDNENTGVFATYTHSVSNWRFNEAIRWDDYSNFGDKITGKFGTKYQFAENHSLSANFGTAYNAPSLIQILNPWGNANPDLTPETTKEISLRYQLSGFTTSIFDKKVEDLIEWNRTQSRYENIAGKTSIQGLEIGYQHSFDTVDLELNYTHLKTEDAKGNELPRRPIDQINLDTTWFINKAWDINFNALYIGERVYGAYDDQTNTSVQYYTVFNSVINYQANKQTQVYLKIDNLTNKYYQVVDGYATAERSAYLGLKYKF